MVQVSQRDAMNVVSVAQSAGESGCFGARSTMFGAARKSHICSWRQHRLTVAGGRRAAASPSGTRPNLARGSASSEGTIAKLFAKGPADRDPLPSLASGDFVDSVSSAAATRRSPPRRPGRSCPRRRRCRCQTQRRVLPVLARELAHRSRLRVLVVIDLRLESRSSSLSRRPRHDREHRCHQDRRQAAPAPPLSMGGRGSVSPCFRHRVRRTAAPAGTTNRPTPQANKRRGPLRERGLFPVFRGEQGRPQPPRAAVRSGMAGATRTSRGSSSQARAV